MCSRHDQPWLEPPEAHGTVCRKRALARGAALLACLLAVTARFRPILMTALATVVGILPIALGRGAGGDSRAPLGIAVAGGR